MENIGSIISIVAVVISFVALIVNFYYSSKKNQKTIDNDMRENTIKITKMSDSIDNLIKNVETLNDKIDNLNSVVSELNKTVVEHEVRIHNLEKEVYRTKTTKGGKK